MLTPADYLSFLNRNGVKLWIDNGQLRYHARKGALSSEELARLRSMRSDIVAELTKASTPAMDKSSHAGPPSAVEAPLSFQQRWLVKLLEKSPSWRQTLSYTLRLKGRLDSVLLEKSFEGVLRMHAALRTRVVRDCGEWRQQLNPGDVFRLPVVRVCGESDRERGQSALLLAHNIGAQELDPVAAPLMRAQLIRVSAHEYFLVLLIHRLATDCLGIGQVFRDLWMLYAETVEKCSSTSLEGSVPYYDYALWQHTTDAAWRQKHGAYWNEYLLCAGPIVWPAEQFAPPASLDGPGGLVSLESSLGETLSAGVRELGRQTQTLPALVMLTLYVFGVSMWCGQRDLVMPFVIAGRAAAQDGVVGCFSHVVYLRIRLKGGESFVELLKLVSNEFYRAAAFRRDCGRMAIERPELLRGTLCQWLSWHPADIGGAQSDGLMSQLGLEMENIRCQSLEELTGVPPDVVDLEMSFFDAAGDISALAICRTDRFAESALPRLMRELRSITERAIEDSCASMVG